MYWRVTLRHKCSHHSDHLKLWRQVNTQKSVKESPSYTNVLTTVIISMPASTWFIRYSSDSVSSASVKYSSHLVVILQGSRYWTSSLGAHFGIVQVSPSQCQHQKRCVGQPGLTSSLTIMDRDFDQVLPADDWMMKPFGCRKLIAVTTDNGTESDAMCVDGLTIHISISATLPT